MKRKLACADFTFPLLTHNQSLDVIAMLGFDGVDIGLFEHRSHLWPSTEFGKLPGAGRELAAKTGDRGLEVADVFLQMAEEFVPYAINQPRAEPRQRARDWFLRTLEYANECACGHVTVLPGAFFPVETEQDSRDRAVSELQWRVQKARDAGLVLGIEAHIGSIAPTPAAAKRLVEAVPGLTLTLDYTHFARTGIPDSDVEPLIEHAAHFHVRGACEGRLQTGFAENSIDYERVVQRMDEVGYRGWLGIEYVRTEWERCNECDNLSETILFRDFLRDLM